MILILRGHIRNSFQDPQLLNFIHKIYCLVNDLKIYIYTWNIVANNISWREIEPNKKPVTEEMIYQYFGETLKSVIQIILIDDDSKISLIGNTEGKIGNTPENSIWDLTPIIGWKNYWYANYQIIQEIYSQPNIAKNELVLNMRFDLFHVKNSNSHYFNETVFMDFIRSIYETRKNEAIHKNIFMCDYEFLGLDNLYVGNVSTMYKLAEHFHFCLDDILQRHKNTIHQEFIVFRENNHLFI